MYTTLCLPILLHAALALFISVFAVVEGDRCEEAANIVRAYPHTKGLISIAQKDSKYCSFQLTVDDGSVFGLTEQENRTLATWQLKEKENTYGVTLAPNNVIEIQLGEKITPLLDFDQTSEQPWNTLQGHQEKTNEKNYSVQLGSRTAVTLLFNESRILRVGQWEVKTNKNNSILWLGHALSTFKVIMKIENLQWKVYLYSIRQNNAESCSQDDNNIQIPKHLIYTCSKITMQQTQAASVQFTTSTLSTRSLVSSQTVSSSRSQTGIQPTKQQERIRNDLPSHVKFSNKQILFTEYNSTITAGWNFVAISSSTQFGEQSFYTYQAKNYISFAAQVSLKQPSNEPKKTVFERESKQETQNTGGSSESGIHEKNIGESDPKERKPTLEKKIEPVAEKAGIEPTRTEIPTIAFAGAGVVVGSIVVAFILRWQRTNRIV